MMTEQADTTDTPEQKNILPDLSLLGSRTGGVTIDDIIAMTISLTGKRPSPETIAACKAKLAAAYPAQASPARQP